MSSAATITATSGQDAGPRWPKGLLALTLLLAGAAPLAMYSARTPGSGELDYLIYYRLLFFNDFTNSLAMLAALLVALAIAPLRAAVSRLAALVTRYPGRTCVLAFVLLASASRMVYLAFPLSMDEYAPLLQARIFAQGDLAATYPRELLDRMVLPGFQGSFLLANHETGQVVSGYWPGLALLMTPFAAVGLDWALNPLLGALGLVLIGDLARQATGREDARGWAMLAALACPQYTINAISYYAMPGLLTLNLFYLWLLLRPGWKSAVLAGAVGSLALVMHNPAPHALFALPCMVWLLSSRARWGRLLPLAAGYLPLTALVLAGWPLLTVSMGLRPAAVSASDTEFVASWIEKLRGTFYLPGLDVLQIRSYAAWKTLVWSAPGLVLVALLTRPVTAIQRLLLAALLVTFVFYFFFPFDQGHGWGYRYLHPAWGLVPLVAGIFAVGSQPDHQRLLAAAICAGLLATPIFALTTHHTVSTSAAQELPLAAEGRTIRFIANQPGMYSADLIRNYPGDSNTAITMGTYGPEQDRELLDAVAPGARLMLSDHRGTVWSIPHDVSFPTP